MTAPMPAPAPTVGPGGGRRRGRRQPPAPGGTSTGFIVVAIISLAAVVLASVALFLIMTRPSATTETSCRAVAWDAVPTSDSLPDGWSVASSGFYTDGYGAALAGPTPSGTQATQPGVNVRVSCYGADGHLAVTRSHASDLAQGGTDLPFAEIGDETVATQDSAGTTMSVYVRRGELVASLAASGVNPDDLQTVAQAVDDAMVQAESGIGSAANPTQEPGATDELGPGASGEVPTEEPVASDSHLSPDLEALLPTKVGTTTLVTDSTTGTDALTGDPASEGLMTALTGLGKTGDDLEFAETYDPTSTVDAYAIALRLKGVAGSTLGQEVMKSWTAATGSGVTTTQQTVGGKKVTVIDYGDQGPKDYVYIQSEPVIVVTTSDPAIAAQMLSALK